MQTRSCDENSVGPFVRLSVKRVICDKTEERSVQIYTPYKRLFSLVFWEEESLVGRPLLPEILGQVAPVGAKSPILNRYSLVAPQPYHLAKKSSIYTNRKSTTRFPMSLRWSSCVAPKSPKGGSKTQNGLFPSKIALRLKKVCCKVSFSENCERQSCKAFIGLTINAKITGGDVPFYLKFWVKLTALERNRRFSIYFRHSPSAVTSREKVQLSLTIMSPRWTTYICP